MMTMTLPRGLQSFEPNIPWLRPTNHAEPVTQIYQPFFSPFCIRSFLVLLVLLPSDYVVVKALRVWPVGQRFTFFM